MSPMSTSPRASQPSHAHTAFTEAAPSHLSLGVSCHQQRLAACRPCLPPDSTCCWAVHWVLMVREVAAGWWVLEPAPGESAWQSRHRKHSNFL